MLEVSENGSTQIRYEVRVQESMQNFRKKVPPRSETKRDKAALHTHAII
jgi:hypothetical protein